MTFKIPAPELQINFALNLAEIRQLYLQTALAQTILGIKIPDLDHQLAELVPPRSLAMLASYGLRGETMFPTPVVLEANARLVAYHRLLYGYSQKEFYTPATGAGRFKQMEERGNLTAACARDLPDLCHAMCIAGAKLLTEISGPAVTAALLNDLTLLTLGAQLRGGANVRKGNAGIVIVFNVIQDIVRPAIINATQERRIAIKNAAKRTVTIEFASAADIVIRGRNTTGNLPQYSCVQSKRWTRLMSNIQFVAEQKANDFNDTKVSHHQTVDGDHDRIETRNYTVIHDIAWSETS